MKRIGKFLCYIPRTGYTMFVHENIDDATTEAQRLQKLHGEPVEILQIVGVVQVEEIPVVEKKIVTSFHERFVKPELPF